MGARSDLAKELRLLTRVIRWTSQGVTWEPDPRHSELLIESMNLSNGNLALTPGAKEDPDVEQKAAEQPKVPGRETERETADGGRAFGRNDDGGG